jgi:hypothetical protein
VSEVVMRLLCEPACDATAEHLRRPHGHFGRNPPFAVHEFLQCRARDAERGGGLRDAQSQRLDALPPERNFAT